MKTTLSAVRTIYNHLTTSGVKSETGLTGGIWWLQKPKNSQLEDIVVNAITMNGAQVQSGVFNVNVHVPNVKLQVDDTQPDFARMEAIAAVVVDKLKDVWGADWNFKVDEPATPERDTDGSWFLNIRISFYTLNN